MAQSMASLKEAVQDVGCNSSAVVTCMVEMQATTAGLGKKVHALTEAVRANTAAIQAGVRLQEETNVVLTRIALRWRAGRQACRDQGMLLLISPPHESPLRSRGSGRRRRGAQQRR